MFYGPAHWADTCILAPCRSSQAARPTSSRSSRQESRAYRPTHPARPTRTTRFRKQPNNSELNWYLARPNGWKVNFEIEKSRLEKGDDATMNGWRMDYNVYLTKSRWDLPWSDQVRDNERQRVWNCVQAESWSFSEWKSWTNWNLSVPVRDYENLCTLNKYLDFWDGYFPSKALRMRYDTLEIGLIPNISGTWYWMSKVQQIIGYATKYCPDQLLLLIEKKLCYMYKHQ